MRRLVGDDLQDIPSPPRFRAVARLLERIQKCPLDHAYAYDALNRPTSITTPDDSEVLPTYNDAGLLETVSVKVRGDSTATDFVTNIDYDEKGRRTKIEYDNGTYRTTPTIR